VSTSRVRGVVERDLAGARRMRTEVYTANTRANYSDMGLYPGYHRNLAAVTRTRRTETLSALEAKMVA